MPGQAEDTEERCDVSLGACFPLIPL